MRRDTSPSPDVSLSVPGRRAVEGSPYRNVFQGVTHACFDSAQHDTNVVLGMKRTFVRRDTSPSPDVSLSVPGRRAVEGSPYRNVFQGVTHACFDSAQHDMNRYSQHDMNVILSTT